MKRFICILLSLAFIVSIAGCAQTNTDKSTVTSTSKVDEKYTGKLPIVDQKVTLKVLCSQGVAAVQAVPSNDLLVYQEYEKLTNVHIEWESLPTATYQEVMTTRLSAGVDLPDMISGVSYNLSSKIGPDGLLLDLTPLIAKNAPRMNAWFSKPENTLENYRRLAPDNKIYGISNIVAPSCLVYGMLINRFWIEKLNLKMPTTVDEFYNMLVAFRDKDPNGNGKKDEIALSTNSGALQMLANSFGLNLIYNYDYNVDSKGIVSDMKTSQRYKDYLTFVNKLFTEELLDKDYLNYTDAKLFEKVKKDTVGSVIHWASWASNLSSMLPVANNSPLVEGYISIAPLKGSNGEQYNIKRMVASPPGLVITKECKNPDVAMKWIDFAIFSQEAQDLYIYGIEGLTYKMENGKKVRIPTTDGRSLDKALIDVGGRQPAHEYMQTVDSRRQLFPEWILKYDDANQKYFIDPFPGIFMPLLPAEKAEMDQFNTDVKTYADSMQAKFITGQESLSKFDEYVKTLNKIGDDKITAINQKRYDRYLKAEKK